MIRLKRVYERAGREDGKRYLVERLWPRGVKKEALRMDGWMKDAAPSTKLRKWFGHDPKKWEEFKRRYRKELEVNSEGVKQILEAMRKGDVTLIYSSHDAEHNNAVALEQYLEERSKRLNGELGGGNARHAGFA
jgi:uncharacterized protein YeaO (DUF488 family)